MNTSPAAPKLDTCGCCEAEAPQPTLYNRPGLSALAYRIGTHSTFLARMLARLPAQLTLNGPTLSDLTTRSRDDLSIAMLDAWATAADVLTFFQERIANEGFLRPATERRSVLELARAIGYELNPGVAASTYLAFTVEDGEGAPGRATIGKGVKVLSIPGQDERPQTFETIEKIEARAEWNALKPRLTAPQENRAGTDLLYLKGIDTQLQPGDAILIVGDDRERYYDSERWDFRIVQTVETLPEDDYTLITWQEALGHEKPTVEPADSPKVFAFRQRAALFGHNAPDWQAMPDTIKKAYDPDNYKPQTPEQSTWVPDWPDFEIDPGDQNRIYLDADYPKILEGSWIALVKPNYVELYKVVRAAVDSCTDFTLTSKSTRLDLDTREHLAWFGLRETVVHAQSQQFELIEKPLTAPVYGTRIVLDQLAGDLEQGQKVAVSGKSVEDVRVAKRTKVVRVGEHEEVQPADDLPLTSEDDPQIVKMLTEGELLEIVEPPLAMADGRVQWHLKDRSGFAGYATAQPDELTPEPASEDDETISEIAFIDRLSADEERTTLILQAPLQHTYDRTTVVINANVAAATHGETVNEALGSGDGAQANQRLQLKKPPLTYVSAPTPSGGESTLSVRVEDVKWEEVPSLYGLGPRDQKYIVRMDDDGNSTAIFGDGQSGARLPSGAENVKATYRSGTGPDGEVTANSLTLMQIRPHGVREVTNPLAASGAAAPEALEDARTNAPLTVLTLDRIVSLQDFEDFARAFAGVGKAKATVLWDGETRLVHITIASASGDPVDTSSDLYQNLTQAIDNVRDPVREVRVDSYERLEFKIEAALLIDSRYVEEKVHAEVEAALEEAYAFKKRALGQPVTATEIVTLIHEVPGVVAVDLNKLYLVEDDETDSQASASADFCSRLPARAARLEEGQIEPKPAQLLLLASAGITLTEMKR